jgi:hypothetical protein
MATQTQNHNAELIGKFLNHYGYSDVNPIGKIIAVKGKTTIIVQQVVASNNKTKMQYIVGGFSAVCTNQSEQEYDFFETEKTMEFRLSKSFLKQYGIDNKPKKFYDFNF